MISFDEMNRIRVLEADLFKQTESLAKESTGFVQKIESFHKSVDSLLAVLSAQSMKIEAAKLLAIGQKNRNKNEEDNRVRLQNDLQTKIRLRKQELQRYILAISIERLNRNLAHMYTITLTQAMCRVRQHCESLRKTEMEQKQLIEKFKVGN
ncbi:hypothetical protein AAMO2058_000393200 [Amorphochlora amoebiformis]